MNKYYRWGMVLFLVGVISASSGCEAIQRKFIRKKKTVEDTQVTAILDPIDYPNKVKSVAQAYQEHYSLWKVWQSDLGHIVEDNASEKKVHQTLDQIKDQLLAMQKLLQEDLQDDLDVYLQKINKISAEFEKSEVFRNKNLISTEIRTLDRDIKKHFAPDKIKDHLAAL